MANQMGQGIEQTAVLCTKPKTKLGYQLKVYEISEEVHEVFEGLMKQHQLLNKRYGPKLHEQPPEELTIADLFEAS